ALPRGRGSLPERARADAEGPGAAAGAAADWPARPLAPAQDRAGGGLRAGPRALSARELRVAFVCTGNRFRSPLAAALLARETGSLPLRIDSLGTLDLGGRSALPEAIAIAEGYGLDLSGHQARALTSVDLKPFDLVLGFERMHVM